MFPAILSALAIFGVHSNTIQKTSIRVDGWTVIVRKDLFTGSVSCGARRGDVRLQDAVVVFSLGRDIDTSDAVYRLNLGAAHSVRDVALRDRVLGARITTEPIDNPSRGLVVLPVSDLLDVDNIWIRATANTPPRRFVVSGLRDVMAKEQTATCS